MAALPFDTVKNENELNKDLAAIAGGTGSYTITFGNGFTLHSDLLAVNLGAGGSLTLEGNGVTINGGGIHRGFFDYAGVLILDNLTIADAVASGGVGGNAATNGSGAGGGGAGLGGGLFVASAGNVTLNNVTFANDKAVGGRGGDDTGSSTEAAGGGGGLGGSGGNARQVKDGGIFVPEDGSGGGIGLSATGGSLSPGGPGIIPTGLTTRIGGGGGAGSGKDYVSGDGGVQPGSFGGGSDGRSRSPGGFGGGGGGSSNGGFGGGGGGGGSGGFGGGNGGFNSKFNPGGGGGGLGAGADVFVQAGGQLTIGTASLGVGTVAGGGPGVTSGGTQATAGSAFGNGIFIQGNQSITFAPPAGVTTTINSIIADVNGSIANSGGAGSVIMNGVGTLKLAVAEPYTGGTKIGSGTLELATPNAAGTGNITFGGVAPGGPAVLQIDTLAMPTNTITGLGTGDTIDVAGLSFVSGATAGIVNNRLTVTSGGQTVTLNVQSANATLSATKDGAGGTDIRLVFPVVKDEQQLNADLASIAGTTTAQKITIGASFSLTGPLLAINLGIGGSLILDGGGLALNGLGSQRGLLVYSGNVTIDNLALNNMTATGGAGGTAANPGGGGAGLGGGLLVASGGNVTLDNVSFSGDAAIGGKGGSYYNLGYAGGGGGGLGGDGGSGRASGLLDYTYDGGGGGLGAGATGGDANGSLNGGAGIVPGTASGGVGWRGGEGGINGGGGGYAYNGDAGGGGIGGQGGNTNTNNFGGNGGFGGGGGGGGSGSPGFSTNGGGSGGFGGGAGGAANSTHTGGFGGGGGGGGDSPGVPGFGGGSGGGGNFGGGGGGGGFGADVLVQQGGRLTIRGGALNAGTVAGGAAGTGRTTDNGGKQGGAGGDGIFLQGNQTVTFAPARGTTLTINGVIADENAFNPGAGSGSVVVSGDGTVRLAANNSYTGGTSLQSGTLELVSKGSGGTGAIAFGTSTSPIETLQLDYVKPGATGVSQVIQSLGVGASKIYLPDVSPGNIVFGSYSGNTLTFQAGGSSYTFSNITVAQSDRINASSIIADKSGTGVDIVPVAKNGALRSVARGNNASGTQTTIAEGTGQTVDAGAGGDTVTLSGGSATLVFHGRRDLAFLGGGTGPVNATIDDQARGLTVDVMNGGTDIFKGLGNDPSVVVDLLGGVGGYAKVAEIMTALTSDGAGGSLLALGAGQSLDILGVAPSALHASNFQIGQR